MLPYALLVIVVLAVLLVVLKTIQEIFFPDLPTRVTLAALWLRARWMGRAEVTAPPRVRPPMRRPGAH